jgi:hypothetical protein
MLSRKDYEKIGRIVSRRILEADGEGDKQAVTALVDVVDDLSRYFAEDNPAFDAQRFSEACVADVHTNGAT